MPPRALAGNEGWSFARLDFQIMARGNENQKATGALYGEWPKGHHSGVRVNSYRPTNAGDVTLYQLCLYIQNQ